MCPVRFCHLCLGPLIVLVVNRRTLCRSRPRTLLVTSTISSQVARERPSVASQLSKRTDLLGISHHVHTRRRVVPLIHERQRNAPFQNEEAKRLGRVISTGWGGSD